jgi:VWFA-related protein
MLDNTQNSSEVLKTLERISETEFEKKTAFYDAIYNGVKKLSSSKFETRVLIVVTDGYDNASKKRLNDIIQSLKENTVTIYQVSLFESERKDILTSISIGVTDEICELTGGWNFVPEKEEHVGLAFSFIAEVLKNQYKITFDLKGTKTNREWHKLKVQLVDNKSKKNTKIKVRQGIFVKKQSN